MTTCIEIDVSQARDQESMIEAFMEALGFTARSQFEFWYYDAKRKLVRIPENDSQVTPEVLKAIKRLYSKKIVAKQARAKGYKIRQISENRWEVHR
jgi:CRISPR/Cas system-associated exonuclease Cas4 (RecB family)